MTPHRPNITQTPLLRFWRDLNDALRARDSSPVTLGIATRLRECGFSVPEALGVLSPTILAGRQGANGEHVR